jgi:hypothetical protein
MYIYFSSILNLAPFALSMAMANKKCDGRIQKHFEAVQKSTFFPWTMLKHRRKPLTGIRRLLTSVTRKHLLMVVGQGQRSDTAITWWICIEEGQVM